MIKENFYDDGGLETQFENYYKSVNSTQINGTAKVSNTQLTDFTTQLKRNGSAIGQDEEAKWLSPYIYGWISKENFPLWYLFSSYGYEVKGGTTTYTFTSDKPKNSAVYLMGYRQIGGTADLVNHTARFRWESGEWKAITTDTTNLRYTLYNRLDNPEWLGMNPIPTNGGLQYCVWTEEENPLQSNYHFIERSPFAGTSISSTEDRLNALMNFFNGDGTLDFWFRGSAPAQQEDIVSLRITDFGTTGIASFTDNDITYYVVITSAIWALVPQTWYINPPLYATRYMPICYVDSEVAEAAQLQTGYSPDRYGTQVLYLDTSTHQITGSNSSFMLNGCYPGAYDCEFKDSDISVYSSQVIGNTLLTRPSAASIQLRLVLKPKSLACALGQYLKFTATADRAWVGTDGGTVLEDKVWYPIYTDNFEITGEFVRGDDPQFASKVADWQTGDITSNELKKSDIPLTPSSDDDTDESTDPYNPPRSNEKMVGDTIGYGNSTRIFPPSTTTYYILKFSDVQAFNDALWAQAKTFYKSLNIVNKQGTDTIFNYIQSYRYYPINFQSFQDWSRNIQNLVNTQTSPLYLGTGAVLMDSNNQYNVQFHPAIGRFFSLFLGNWFLRDLPWTDSFLDYNPYSKLVMTIPYYGDVELDINMISSYTSLKQCRLQLSATADLDTGTLTYHIFVGDVAGNMYFTAFKANVKIGVDMPLSGNDTIAQANAILQSTYKLNSTVLNVGETMVKDVAKVASGVKKPMKTMEGDSKLELPVGDIAQFAKDAVSGVNDLANAVSGVNLSKRQVPVSVGNTNGTMGSTIIDQYPYLSLFIQRYANPLNYGHTTGFVCESTLKLSDVSGFTVLSNPDLSDITGATAEEINELNGILTSGFFVGIYKKEE